MFTVPLSWPLVAVNTKQRWLVPVCVCCLLLLLPTTGRTYHNVSNKQHCKNHITLVQNKVASLLEDLEKAKGDNRSLIEFRIEKNLNTIQADIGSLIARENSEKDRDFLLNALEKQLNYTHAMSLYFSNAFNEMERNIKDPTKDVYQLLQMAKIENKHDAILLIENANIQWIDHLKVLNNCVRKSAFIEKMKNRSYKIISYINYSKDQLEDLILILPKNKDDDYGYNITHLLQKRLHLISDSLETAINILDAHKVNTLDYKEVLIYTTGEITHNSFNLSVFAGILKHWKEQFIHTVIKSGPEFILKMLLLIIIFAFAWLTARVVKSLIQFAFTHSRLHTSKLLKDFITNITGKLIMFAGCIMALSQLGVSLMPILAGLGIAGLVIGFALKETLSNFASGIMILIYRPFDMGDIISAAGVTGVVNHMNLVSTTIKTYNNERLIIPNTKIWENIIDNLTAERERRVDMLFSVSYRADIPKVEGILMSILTEHPLVLKSPAPQVRVHKLSPSSVDMATRPWVKPDDYWTVYWDVTRAVKLRFDEEHVVIPYPQMDVHYFSPDRSDPPPQEPSPDKQPPRPKRPRAKKTGRKTKRHKTKHQNDPPPSHPSVSEPDSDTNTLTGGGNAGNEGG